MDIIDWIILGLALVLSGVGAFLVAAWVLLRQVDEEDDWR
jgi:hypothetical protein